MKIQNYLAFILWTLFSQVLATDNDDSVLHTETNRPPSFQDSDFNFLGENGNKSNQLLITESKHEYLTSLQAKDATSLNSTLDSIDTKETFFTSHLTRYADLTTIISSSICNESSCKETTIETGLIMTTINVFGSNHTYTTYAPLTSTEVVTYTTSAIEDDNDLFISNTTVTVTVNKNVCAPMGPIIPMTTVTNLIEQIVYGTPAAVLEVEQVPDIIEPIVDYVPSDVEVDVINENLYLEENNELAQPAQVQTYAPVTLATLTSCNEFGCAFATNTNVVPTFLFTTSIGQQMHTAIFTAATSTHEDSELFSLPLELPSAVTYIATIDYIATITTCEAQICEIKTYPTQTSVVTILPLEKEEPNENAQSYDTSVYEVSLTLVSGSSIMDLTQQSQAPISPVTDIDNKEVESNGISLTVEYSYSVAGAVLTQLSKSSTSKGIPLVTTSSMQNYSLSTSAEMSRNLTITTENSSQSIAATPSIDVSSTILSTSITSTTSALESSVDEEEFVTIIELSTLTSTATTNRTTTVTTGMKSSGSNDGDDDEYEYVWVTVTSTSTSSAEAKSSGSKDGDDDEYEYVYVTVTSTSTSSSSNVKTSAIVDDDEYEYVYVTVTSTSTSGIEAASAPAVVPDNIEDDDDEYEYVYVTVTSTSTSGIEAASAPAVAPDNIEDEDVEYEYVYVTITSTSTDAQRRAKRDATEKESLSLTSGWWSLKKIESSSFAGNFELMARRTIPQESSALGIYPTIFLVLSLLCLSLLAVV